MDVICIVAAGPVELIPSLNDFKKLSPYWIGVDRGLSVLKQNGIEANAAFGDFDSVSEEERNEFNRRESNITFYPSEKDETDLQLALDWAIKQNPRKIYILGATGGRMDHFMGAVQLLVRDDILFKNETEIFLVDQKNYISAKVAGSYLIQEDSTLKYISFFPMSEEVIGLTLKGFKYPLLDMHISRGSTLCISNELISSHGHFSFESGILLVVRSRD
ncbi:thiamine diphosphokinase [Peribacillus alkalitolerans]|uniref:thiamine diphosphokinase n=1 Tax=Peribacillus alkalitolerans TaxID=1550385 RepID=UPI0013D45E64|nr:thiamine diphosphokinase [Peribacillus alkalitolerans]